MKSKFQSSEDFMKDYEAYKKGKRYKIIFTDTLNKKQTVEYVKDSLYKIRFESISYFYSENTIGVVDLKHKFEVVCKVE